ncbi:MAG: helix-turn-helix domain-containing protein [Bacteroidota bacterium]
MNTYTLAEGKDEELLFILTYASYSEQEELLLVPDNFAEIIIPISEKKIELRIIGTKKQLTVNRGSIYFLPPRRRGMEVSFEKETQFAIIKLNPIYTKVIANNLTEVCTGVYDCEASDKMSFQLRLGVNLRDLRAVSGWISTHLLRGQEEDKINSTIEESISRIKDTGGSIKIKELYTNLNISKSKLEKHFNSELQMTPKEFCKIEKINRFIKSYHNRYGQNLTELTYKCGYYDQSHLIKDFKYFLDTSPKRYFAKANDSC